MKGLEEIKRENIDAARRAASAADRTPRIVCDKCDGAGHHKLSEPYANTYDVLTSGWQPTEMVRELLHKRGDKVASTALINRLQFLASYRLVEYRQCLTNKKRLEWRAR